MNIITTTNELNEFCQTLAKSDFITVDTEFIRESTYWPELCLIQLASPQAEAIIDPLAKDIALQPFFDLMANEAIIKVFHAARQDIEIIYHLSGIIPSPLFDTQVAAMVCGYGDSISYEQLVSKTNGAHIDKSSRFTDWSHRPLSPKQLDYALADVTHLRDVYVKLHEQLKNNEREGWLNEEMAILTSPATYNTPLQEAWRRVKGHIRKPIEQMILQEVAAWRETEARNRNVPRGRVMKDDGLIEIAQQQPKDIAAMARLRSVPKGWERSESARKLLETVQKASETPKDQLPKIKKQKTLPEGSAAAMDLMRVLLKLVADENQVASKLIATSDDIEKIIVEGKDAAVLAMSGWRYDMFGRKALAMLEGKIAFRFIEKQIKAFELE